MAVIVNSYPSSPPVISHHLHEQEVVMALELLVSNLDLKKVAGQSWQQRLEGGQGCCAKQEPIGISRCLGCPYLVPILGKLLIVALRSPVGFGTLKRQHSFGVIDCPKVAG